MGQVPYQAAGQFSWVLGQMTLPAALPPTHTQYLLPLDPITTDSLPELRKGVAGLSANAQA